MTALPQIPDPPAKLKGIQSFIKIASDIERVDPIVAYWVRLHATETGFKIDKDSVESKAFLAAIISWLEKFKRVHPDNEMITNPTVGQAHYENFVVALFNKADTSDREGVANKNTIRMFYMAAVLFEAMAVFGPITEENNEKAKYAKFKAAYITKCLKTGQVPKPGPIEGSDLDPSSAESSQPTDTAGELPQMPQVPSSADKSPSPEKQDPFILTPQPAPVFPPVNPNANKFTEHSETPTPKPQRPEPTKVEPTVLSHATNGTPLRPEDLVKAQKYCKFANSALMYDDIPTAVANLEKALGLLKTGHKSEN